MTGADLQLDDLRLEAVSETLFLPLYALAAESRQERPVVSDPEVVGLTERLNVVFSRSEKRVFRRLATKGLPPMLVATLALRIRHFDTCVRTFLQAEPDAVVVNLGCGLDNRRNRVDNGRMHWYEVDLPEVIALRRRFFPETDRFRSISSSVLDLDWIEQIRVTPGDRLMFVAEGLFMYLPKDGVVALVRTLRGRFPGSRLLAELAHRRVVRISRSPLGRGKFRRQFGLSENVFYQCGLDSGREMESWAPGVKLLDEWTYFDDAEPRLRWLRPLARWKLFRYAQWTGLYRLGEGDSR